MTNEEIIDKAAAKAKLHWYLPGTTIKKEDLFYNFIFSHEFAKAFWGDGDKKKTRRMQLIGDKYYPFYQDGWRVHLQQMVLEENPIKYLSKFLD